MLPDSTFQDKKIVIEVLNGHTKLTIDGRDIPDVQTIRFYADAKRPFLPELELKFTLWGKD